MEELKAPEREVFKLTITNNPNIIQGAISLEVKSGHVFMHLIESAPFNIGKDKIYLEFRGTWSLLPVNYRFSAAMRAMFLSLLKQT